MEGKEMRLSIIVPMYKVAPYVERCIRSLANQDISREEYEIICVNDGSPDNCREIVERLQQEISNLVLLNQENQGVSMARNKAIARSKGRYLLPIDPDDFLVHNCLKNPLEQAERDSLDVLYGAFEIFDVNHLSIWRSDYSGLTHAIDTGYDGYFAVRGPKVKDPDRSWAILYKSALLKKYRIAYPRDVPMLEDGLFLGKVFSVAQRVGYSNCDFYHRTTRLGSATNSGKWQIQETLNGYLCALKDIKHYESKNQNVNQELFNHLVAKFCFLALSIPIRNLDVRKYLAVSRVIHAYVNKIELEGIKYNYFRMMKVYKFSSILYFFLHRFLR